MEDDHPWRDIDRLFTDVRNQQRLYAAFLKARFGSPIASRCEELGMTDEDIQLEFALMRSQLRLIELCSHKGEFCAACWSRETDDE